MSSTAPDEESSMPKYSTDSEPDWDDQLWDLLNEAMDSLAEAWKTVSGFPLK